MAPDMSNPGIILPDEVEEVIILADNDGDRETTEALLIRAQRRWKALGLRVSIVWPPRGMDMNDWLQARLAKETKADPRWPSEMKFEDTKISDGVIGQPRSFSRQDFRVP